MRWYSQANSIPDMKAGTMEPGATWLMPNRPEEIMAAARNPHLLAKAGKQESPEEDLFGKGRQQHDDEEARQALQNGFGKVTGKRLRGENLLVEEYHNKTVHSGQS